MSSDTGSATMNVIGCTVCCQTTSEARGSGGPGSSDQRWMTGSLCPTFSKKEGLALANYKRCNWQRSQNDRRRSAEALAVLREKRTDEEQLELLNDRPGNSAKERARLLKRIEERKNAPKTPKKGKKGRKKAKQ